MKRFLAVLMAVVMLLALCACGGSGGQDGMEEEIHQLFDKYSTIIYMLEDEQYQIAVQEIVRMSNQGRDDLTSMDQTFQAEWYSEIAAGAGAPGRITVNEDGVVDVDGREFSLLVADSNSEYLWGWLLEDGTCVYHVELSFRGDSAIPRLVLFTARETADGYQSGDWLAEYYNDAMLPYLLMSWRKMGGDESMDNYIYLDYEDASINDEELSWSITASEGSTITADINGTYTVAVELRGELPMLTLTENATGATADYCSDLGYDVSWPEYIYPQAMKGLNECLEDVANGYNPDFWYDVGDVSEKYSGNEAWKKLYEVFSQLGDYKDSAGIVGRFTILKDMYTGASLLSVDNMGNESTNSDYEYFKYNSLGQMVTGKSWDIRWLYGGDGYAKYFTYDESGRISKIQQGTGNNVEWVVTPVYDSEGRMVGGTYQSNSYTHELSYTYDDQGRLIENIVWSNSHRSKHTYTYDESGNLVKDVYWYGSSEPNYNSYRYTVDYTYDAQGYLIKRVWTEEYYRSYSSKFDLGETYIWVYTNDAQGRPVSAEYTTLDSSGNTNYASRTITYNYDDLYFFD